MMASEGRIAKEIKEILKDTNAGRYQTSILTELYICIYYC